ncbi:hypothetical protein M8J77_012291 [Diaphorina citri]|nr:hypothetical protein M8J77_012291 [Diaphorina citri]
MVDTNSQNINQNYMNFPTIIQWNVNGVTNKKEDLQLLVQALKPVMICLQETHLLPTVDITDYLKNYTVYRNDFTDGLIACGGVATLVNKNVYSEQIPITSNLQVIAVKIKAQWLSYEVAVGNIYVRPNPDSRIEEKDLTNILNQLPKPCFLCGDFNAHSCLWGASRNNENGNEIENFLQKNDSMFLLNDNQVTHVNSSYRTCSTLDLSFVSSSIVSDVIWSVHDDTYHSDHYPVLIKILSHNTGNTNTQSKEVWLYKKADWSKFREKIKFHENLELTNCENIEEVIEIMNNDILKAANLAIPKLNTSKIKRMVPWWSDVIKNALKERREALKRYKENRSLENFIEYKKKKAKARYEIKSGKKCSWMRFVDSINEPVNQTDMWNRIRRFKGKSRGDPISAMKTEDDRITLDKKEIVEILAKNYVKNSSDELYSAEFKRKKSLEENKFGPAENTEQCEYNLPFTYGELTRTFKKCRSASIGVDGISYQMIIHLPQEALVKLLEIFNLIWTRGIFPLCWKTAIVVPILKPNKDKLNPINYRPISLLSCVNKILERMINVRLSWVLNHTPCLNDAFQSGNRQNRSTMDNLMWLEHEVLTAFQKKEVVVAILLDIEKAYERTTSLSVIRKLSNAGVGGPLFKYVQNFLNRPRICVKIWNTSSNTHELDNSIRQGSSLSGNIFGLSVADIGQVIPHNVNHSMFVDDKIIFMRHHNIEYIQETLQATLDKLLDWSKTNGLKFSLEKTFGMVFTKKRELIAPRLYFSEHRIEFQREIKWLGLYLDPKWTFKNHIKKTKIKSLKALNVLKILGNKNWELSRQCLLKLFHAFIRPILDYGSVIYGGVNETKLDVLNSVYHAALRIVTGALRTSPVQSLYVESGQAPLRIRRKILLSNYVIKLLSHPENPGYTILMSNHFDMLRDNENIPKTIRNRMDELSVLNRTEVAKNIFMRENQTPPWIIASPTIIYLLNENKKSLIPQQARNSFLEFKSQNLDSLFIFTDGTKTATNTGFAYHLNGKQCVSSRPSDEGHTTGWACYDTDHTSRM